MQRSPFPRENPRPGKERGPPESEEHDRSSSLAPTRGSATGHLPRPRGRARAAGLLGFMWQKRFKCQLRWMLQAGLPVTLTTGMERALGFRSGGRGKRRRPETFSGKPNGFLQEPALKSSGE